MSANGVIDGSHSRNFVINQIHRYLDQVARLQPESQRFDERQASVARPDRTCDLPRYGDVSAAQNHVECDQKRPRAHRNRAGGFVDLGQPFVRRTLGIGGDLFAKQFQRAATHVLEIHSLRSFGGSFVKVHGDREIFCDNRAGFVSETHAVVHRYALHGHERQHVGCAKPRVLALVRAHVDELGSSPYGAYRSLDDSLRRRDECNDGAVVVRVDMCVEHTRRFNGSDGVRDQLHSFRPSAFAEVWYAFDQSHGNHLNHKFTKYSIVLLVPPDRFINQRKNAWQRLEDLLKLLDTASLRRLRREEVRELGRIYRRTASDLAIARAESRDPRLINYLNSLVIRAHGRIYRADAQGGKRIRHFFARELPQTFRRTWRYTLLSFSVFALFSIFGFVGTYYDPEFSELVGVQPAWREMNIETKTPWWESLNEANQIGASAIMTNNILVTIYTFAFGALCGVGTLFYLAFNGAHIASVVALTYRAGFGNDLVTFMVAHGVVELSCIFIAGGAGLLIGSAIIMPGNLSRADALRTRGMEAVRLMMGVAVLLVLAGIIEGFISPAPIDPRIKYSIAALTGLTLYAYLLLLGHDKPNSK